MWNFPDHIYRPTFPQFLRIIFMGYLFVSTHRTNKSSVLLNNVSASICFVLCTNCNRLPALSADITGIVNVPLDCVRVISWRLLRCVGYAALYEKTFMNSELAIPGRIPPWPIYRHSLMIRLPGRTGRCQFGFEYLPSRRVLNHGPSQYAAMLPLSCDVYSQNLTFIFLLLWTLIWRGRRPSEHFSFHNVPLSLNWAFLWGSSCFIVVIFVTTFLFFCLLPSHFYSSYPLLPSPSAVTNWLSLQEPFLPNCRILSQFIHQQTHIY